MWHLDRDSQHRTSTSVYEETHRQACGGPSWKDNPRFSWCPLRRIPQWWGLDFGHLDWKNLWVPTHNWKATQCDFDVDFFAWASPWALLYNEMGLRSSWTMKILPYWSAVLQWESGPVLCLTGLRNKLRGNWLLCITICYGYGDSLNISN